MKKGYFFIFLFVFSLGFVLSVPEEDDPCHWPEDSEDFYCYPEIISDPSNWCASIYDPIYLPISFMRSLQCSASEGSPDGTWALTCGPPDLDGDGFYSFETFCVEILDCNDTDASINPNATEIIGDGIDNDCNPSTLDSCVESLVNSTATSWENITSCNVSDELTQMSSWVEYDENNCGTFENVTYYDYQIISCDYCLPSRINTSWSDWENFSCSGDEMNQSQFKIEYDENFCYLLTGLESDLSENVTYYNYQLVGPNYINTSWSEFENVSSCLINDTFLQEQNFTQYDEYGCASNSTYYNYTELGCNYCSYDVVNTSWSSWQDLDCFNTTHRNQSRSLTEYDQNNGSCYSVTGLESDLFNSGENNTYYEYQLIEDGTCYSCTESLTNTSWGSWENVTSCNLSGELTQSRSLVEYDENSCGSFTNVTYYQNQTISCDYCLSDCSCAVTTCSGYTCSDGCGGTCAGTKSCGGGGGGTSTCSKYVPLTFEECNLNSNSGIFFVETYTDSRGCKSDSCVPLGYDPLFVCEEWSACIGHSCVEPLSFLDPSNLILTSNEVFYFYAQEKFRMNQDKFLELNYFNNKKIRRCISFPCLLKNDSCSFIEEDLIFALDSDSFEDLTVKQNCSCSFIFNECVPNWKCDWSSCLNDEEFSYAYNCFDLNFCNSFLNKPIRKVCENFSDEVVCGNWSSCSYDVDLNYLINRGDLTSAFKRRECFNSTSSWFEKQVCFFGERIIERCDNCSEDVFIIKDPFTGDSVGEVILKGDGLLNIYFNNAKRYSNHCYNLILDGDETGIDCGGSCKDCLSLFSISFFSCKFCLFFWILFLLVLILLERFIYYSEGLRFFGLGKGIIFLWEMTFKKFFDWLFYHDVSSQQDFSKIKVIYFNRSVKKKK